MLTNSNFEFISFPDFEESVNPTAYQNVIKPAQTFDTVQMRTKIGFGDPILGLMSIFHHDNWMIII